MAGRALALTAVTTVTGIAAMSMAVSATIARHKPGNKLWQTGLGLRGALRFAAWMACNLRTRIES